MTPEFAQRVDPVFLHVLGLLDRIGRNENPSPTEERAHIRGWIDQAERALGQTDEWMLAKYALAAWIDEVLIEAPWDGRRWWEENPLEFELFRMADAYYEYFRRATEAAKLTTRDALEVFYVGVVLGFRGMYRDPASAEMADQNGLPPDRESWALATARAIRLGQGRPPLDDSGRAIRGAPPLEGRFTFLGVSLIAIVLAVVASMLAWWVVVRPASDRSAGRPTVGRHALSSTDCVVCFRHGVSP